MGICARHIGSSCMWLWLVCKLRVEGARIEQHNRRERTNPTKGLGGVSGSPRHVWNMGNSPNPVEVGELLSN